MKEVKNNHTFVICAYKSSPYLEVCIESLLAQTSVLKKESSVILYTSTPNDFITELCEKYDIPQFSDKGGSIGADWNKALSFVKTKYATIAHQDDIYEADYGVKILQVFKAREDLNIAFSDYYEIDEEGKSRSRNINLKVKTFGLKLLSLLQNKTYQRRIYAFGNFICCPAVSYNMERLKDFKFNEEMRMALDWDAWERIMRLPGHIKYLSERLMAHRIHGESETTVNTQNEHRKNEEYEIFERYWGKGLSKLFMMIYQYNKLGNKHE
ncbi:glycosyltransferase [Lactococcus nasutitermitis]|uniref:Glycosyltransferase n=1 Tax=Lactococcus nasutitermitis TaxID=1652957 RepID=A0ABV9JEF8_9LACT|nr:glycosyltransferase [Lactococcus nasutitermitis]